MNGLRSLCCQMATGRGQILHSTCSSLLKGKKTPQLSIAVRKFSSEEDQLTEMPVRDPTKGELVYGGAIWKLVKGVKAFSVSTSIISLGAQPYIFMNAGDVALTTKLAVGGTMAFFVFGTPLLIHFVTKKYVRDCYFNRETGVFTASTFNFFIRRKEVQFTASDVVVPEVPGMFTTIVVKGTPLFMDPSMFYNKDAYIHLMGYDKPLDLQMPDFRKKEPEQEK